MERVDERLGWRKTQPTNRLTSNEPSQATTLSSPTSNPALSPSNTSACSFLPSTFLAGSFSRVRGGFALRLLICIRADRSSFKQRVLRMSGGGGRVGRVGRE